jgi:hypothetical protein
MPVTGSSLLNGQLKAQHAGNARSFEYLGRVHTIRLSSPPPYSDDDYATLAADIMAGPNVVCSGDTLEAALDALVALRVRGSLTYHEAVRVATTEQIVLEGEIAVDGVTLSAGDRVLVMHNPDGCNGVYVVATGRWARADDTLVPGAAVPVTAGDEHADATFFLATGYEPYGGIAGTLDVGRTNLEFVELD